MKINEFIDKVNRVAHVEIEGEYIYIYERPSVDEDWFLLLRPNTKDMTVTSNWSHLHVLSANNLSYIFDLLKELKETSINKRFSKKRYRLRWIDDNAGDNYFKLWHDGVWSFSSRDKATIFTENQLKEIKQVNPRYVPAIDAMKEPVLVPNDKCHNANCNGIIDHIIKS